MSKRKEISRGKRFRILARDNFRCVYCGAKPSETELHIDHLFPICEGGDSSDSNLVTACADCNIGKRGQIVSDLSDAHFTERAMRALDEVRRVVNEFRAEANRELLLAFQAYDGRQPSKNDVTHRCVKEQRRIYEMEAKP